MDVNSLVEKYQKIVGRKEAIENSLRQKEDELSLILSHKTNAEYALEIIQKVALETQSSLKYNIEAPVTAALEAILDEPYEFKLNFDIKRNKTECALKFSRNGLEVTPKDASGGTALDIASIALRIALHSIAVNKTKPIFILDESTKHVSADKREAVSTLIKELSDKLGIQFIIVSHDEKLTASADSVFRVTLRNGVSSIKKASL